jgi:prepilin-type N-terminal cleavage/methylation domain-containing protein
MHIEIIGATAGGYFHYCEGNAGDAIVRFVTSGRRPASASRRVSKMKRRKLRSRGLTLIELIVVVAILAVLAMIVIPKLDGLQSNANHAVESASLSDTSRYLQVYRTGKQRFPDGWDSLMDGAAIWAAANPGNTAATGTPPYGKGMHRNFHGSNAKFVGGTLTAADVAGLNAAGIYTFYDVTPALAATKRPGDMFTTSRTIADGSVAVFVNASTAAGRNIIDHVYRDNQKAGGISGAIPNNNKLLAVGLGPFNKMVGTIMLEAPGYGGVDTSLVYNRNIVLFEVGGSKALFRGVVAPDGDLMDDVTADINRDL